MTSRTWIERTLAVALTAALAGCGGGQTSVDDAVVVPDTTPTAATTPAPASTPTPAPTPAPAPAETKGTETATTPAPAPAPAPAGGGDYGTIKGKLVFGGDPPTLAPKVKKGDQSVKDPQVCAVTDIPNQALVVDGSKGVANGFAYLVQPKGANPAAVAALKGQKALMDQKDCVFLPHALAIHTDQELVFKSSDPVNHNVHYTPFDNQDLGKNQSLPPNGEMAVKLKPERRAVSVVCDIHPWMNAWFMAFDHPFFALTKPDGTFEIQGVPAGDQQFVIWHEAVGYVTVGAARGQKVTVKKGETTDVGEIKIDAAKVKVK